ncbi:putative lysine acetyltransferase [Rosellinia necatrix]|uniref:Putative lysine acetyltransferase n=1 Tax=Rosellinia necatrix TaxID=77044 RepID=A0A1W2TUN0_ROSNE|nr:putative lysine acetyltransferase [Rosellinia necatrix]
MGSLAADVGYPDASDGSLVLAHPTAAEMERTWRLNHREWGGALDLESYLQREPFLASTALTADGGMMHWILTEDGAQPGQRSVLASCETIRKRVLYAEPPAEGGSGNDSTGEVREGLSYGVGSVYTYPEFRGRKYAARMLRDLGAVLKTWPGEEEKTRKKRAQARGSQGQSHHHDVNGTGAKTDDKPGNGNAANGNSNGNGNMNGNGCAKPQGAGAVAEEAVCSALWSDIGKRFYASKGWPAFASEHVEVPSSSPLPAPGVATLLERAALARPHLASLALRPVTAGNLARLCAEDEARLRRQLARHARAARRTAFAFAPDPDVFRWHWAREEFIVARVFPGRAASEVRGMEAVVTYPSPSSSTPISNGASTDVAAETRGVGEGQAESRTRMWAVWTRNFGADAASNPAKNTLYILRLVIDDDDDNNDDCGNSVGGAARDPKALQLAFDAIMHSALDAARAWHCGAVHLWNPTPAVRRLVAGSGLAHRFVDREVDSIPSMMWYGPGGGGGGDGGSKSGKGQAVDWIANEKYCWC